MHSNIFKACAGVRYDDSGTNVGVKIDPRNCLTLEMGSGVIFQLVKIHCPHYRH